MIFGKIEYLNLLPFHIFMKRYIRSSQAKAIMEFKKDVPANINKKFIRREVDAAFISSIAAKNYAHLRLGIIAKREVRSVLSIPSTSPKEDKESASSNILAQILQQQGEVLIGDKALRYALSNNNYTDLALLWHQKYKLPFVFALLCFHSQKKKYQKLEKKFLYRPVKIPQYILKKAANKTAIAPKEILNYLELISYTYDYKAALSLKKFYKEAAKLKP